MGAKIEEAIKKAIGAGGRSGGALPNNPNPPSIPPPETNTDPIFSTEPEPVFTYPDMPLYEEIVTPPEEVPEEVAPAPKSLGKILDSRRALRYKVFQGYQGRRGIIGDAPTGGL